MSRRRRVGRVKIEFAKLEAMVATEVAECRLPAVFGTEWKLTRHSALYRCKNGLYTLCLVWHGPEGHTLTMTTRNVELEAA